MLGAVPPLEGRLCVTLPCCGLEVDFLGGSLFWNYSLCIRYMKLVHMSLCGVLWLLLLSPGQLPACLPCGDLFYSPWVLPGRSLAPSPVFKFSNSIIVYLPVTRKFLVFLFLFLSLCSWLRRWTQLCCLKLSSPCPVPARDSFLHFFCISSLFVAAWFYLTPGGGGTQQSS